MDSISNLFRINLITTCSESTKSQCDLNALFKNYDSISDLTGVTFRHLSTNTAHQINSLRLRISNIDDVKSRPDQTILQKVLHDVVAEESNKYETAHAIELIDTPWFERWKEKFISYHNMYDHDFIGANFGVLIIVSADDLASFDGIVSTLLAQVRDCSQLRFMTNGFIEHYVVVQFVDEDLAKTAASVAPNANPDPVYQQAYKRFVNCFGVNNCSWLTIPKNQPGQNLAPFLRSFVSRSLVPWCERQVRVLNDAISTRKGLRRNLVIATRQLLNIGQSSYLNQSIVYTPDASEMQCRKLGDIAMCLGLYELASSSYDTAKKEFLNDNAWLYYAGACEAYASARSMLKKFQKSHIEKAVTTYIESCKSINLATRATIIATDITKKISPVDAAKFFVTLIGDDSDLRSALFLEQASRCYSLCPTRLRKAAFYHVLAGYRYSKCGLKKLSLRCYAKFQESQWEAAAEHVESSLKRTYKQLGINEDNEEKLYLPIATKKLPPILDLNVRVVSPPLREGGESNIFYYTGETIKLSISLADSSTSKESSENYQQSGPPNSNIEACSTKEPKLSWRPTKLCLYSNGDLLTTNGVLTGNKQCLWFENPSEVNYFYARVPQTPYKHVLYFKFNYFDKDDNVREAIKSISLNVIECLSVLSVIDHVISIRNVINDHNVSYSLVSETDNQEFINHQILPTSRSIIPPPSAQKECMEDSKDVHISPTEPYHTSPNTEEGYQADPSMISNVPPNLIAHLLMKCPYTMDYLDHPLIRWTIKQEQSIIRHGVCPVEL